MRKKQNQLEAEITFLKDQIKALWETIQLPPETTNTSSQTSREEMDDKFNDSTKNKAAITTSNDNEWSEVEILLVRLPTLSLPFKIYQKIRQEKKHKTYPKTLIPSTLPSPLLPTTPIILMQ